MPEPFALIGYWGDESHGAILSVVRSAATNELVSQFGGATHAQTYRDRAADTSYVTYSGAKKLIGIFVMDMPPRGTLAEGTFALIPTLREGERTSDPADLPNVIAVIPTYSEDDDGDGTGAIAPDGTLDRAPDPELIASWLVRPKKAA